jgi:hypothetical protein
VVFGVGLFLAQLQPQHFELQQQDERINAFASSALEDVLVPGAIGVAVGE